MGLLRARRYGIALTAAVTTALLLTGCTAAPAPDAGGTPTATAPGSAVPANADGYGLVAGTGPVQISVWTDLSCPFCSQLEHAVGADINEWVDAGDVTLTIHPLAFVSQRRGDATDWSTRAANALAAVADAGEGHRLAAFYAILQENQPASDEVPPTDEHILQFADQAGVTADIREAVETRRFGAWVASSQEHWIGNTIEGTEQVVQGVPILVVNGQVFELTGDGTDAARLRAIVEAALAA